jgi:hypothetical protein
MSFDLNINNYQKKELEEIFGLPNEYNVEIVEMRENKLRDNIISDPSVTDIVRSQTLEFLQKAKDNLVSSIKNEIFNKAKTMNIYNTDTSLRPSQILSENGSQFIIERPATPFSQSFPSEFYPGTINPLKKRSTRQNLNIDTRFRENYYNTQSTNFHLDLPIKFSNVLSLQLSAFEVATTYYVISKQYGNNFFWITIIESSGVETKAAIIVPDGNYTPSDLLAYLNNYVSATGPLGSTETIFNNLVFTINITPASSGSGQMIIGFSSGSTLVGATIILDFQANLQGNPDVGTPLPLKFGWHLGFRLGIYEGNNTYVSEGLVNLTGPKYFYLVVDDYNNNVNNSFYSAFTSSILNKNILARISYQDGSFINISENNLSIVTTPRQYFGPVDILKLNIQLLDEFGRIVDLNNMDYSFCLTMQSVYDL